jgi:hypothetical protein
VQLRLARHQCDFHSEGEQPVTLFKAHHRRNVFDTQ